MNVTAEEVMTRDVVSVQDTITIQDLVKILFSKRVSGVPVVDRAHLHSFSPGRKFQMSILQTV